MTDSTTSNSLFCLFQFIVVCCPLYLGCKILLAKILLAMFHKVNVLCVLTSPDLKFPNFVCEQHLSKLLDIQGKSRLEGILQRTLLKQTGFCVLGLR